MILWWRKRKAENSTPDTTPELAQVKRVADDLSRRTRKLVRENNLAADIRKALGAR